MGDVYKLRDREYRLMLENALEIGYVDMEKFGQYVCTPENFTDLDSEQIKSLLAEL